MDLIVGIDASRNRSGGAKAHLAGILAGARPKDYGIRTVHLWVHRALAQALPDYPWLVKHSPAALEKALPFQIWWQRWTLPREAQSLRCDVIFNTDAGSVSRYRPSVTLNQDLLSYEPGEIKRYGITRARLRLCLLRAIQNRSLSQTDCAIFLTHHAADVVQQSSGKIDRYAVIPHGVGEEFRRTPDLALPPQDPDAPVQILYVSNAAMYKHQWHVVQAVDQLRKRGFNVVLRLVGGGTGPAQRRLERELAATDPTREFARQEPFLQPREILAALRDADVFVFASSCEAFGITLLEAMASGLPIACSNRSCMPELLRDGGVYFDPESPSSIAAAIQGILVDQAARTRIALRAKQLSEYYTWERASHLTWKLLSDCARSYSGNETAPAKQAA